jgi:uncharacterized protein (DUF2147 family)
MFRTVLLSFLAVFFAGGISTAGAQPQDVSPLGLWLTENGRSVVNVTPCKADTSKVCGRIHWIIEGGMQFDTANPDPAQHTAPMCGLQIMWGFHQNDAMNWIDGNIYKADEGDSYSATLQMLPSGKMLVRGYVGMPLFGKSQTWTRVTGVEHPRCKPAR